MSNEEVKTLREKIDSLEKTVGRFEKTVDKLHLSLSEHIVKTDPIFDRFDSQESSFRRHTLNSEETRRMHKEIIQRMEAHEKKMEPVYLAFTGLDWSKKALIWILGLATTILGIVIGIKQLYK